MEAPAFEWSDGRSRPNGGRLVAPECDNCTKRAQAAPTGTNGGVTIMWISTPAAREARCEYHDGGDHQGKGESSQYEKEGRVSRAERNGEQDDRDHGDRDASPCRSQAGDSRTGVHLVFRQCRAAARGGLAGHGLSSGFGRRPVSRALGVGFDGRGRRRPRGYPSRIVRSPAGARADARARARRAFWTSVGTT